MELLKIGLKEWRAMVVVCQNGAKNKTKKSGFLTSVRDFLAVFPARHAEPAGIILKLRSNYGIMRLKVCGSDSVKCIWEKPVRG